ncbi:ABC transporter permease, partial [bacterium]|nr:ABC transporter permease [bacterium]
MIFWLRFALRSCLRRRRRTIITLAGIAFGVATLVVLGAIMVGVNDTMVKNAVAIHSGNIVVKGTSLPLPQAFTRIDKLIVELESFVELETILPRLHFPALITSDHDNSPINIVAVDPRREILQTPVGKRIVVGTYLENDEGLLLGEVAAKKLAVKPGDKVTLITSTEVYEIKVSGIFSLAIDAFDRSMAFIALAQARTMLNLAVNYEITLFTRSQSDLAQIAKKLNRKLDSGEEVHLWSEILPEVAQLVKLNEFSMAIMVMLVIIILGFGVANALLISVMDRYRHFAILKAIGVRPHELFLVIMAEAFFMCLVAAILGTILGSAVTFLWADYGLDLSRYTSANPHFSVNSIIYPRLTPTMVFAPQM